MDSYPYNPAYPESGNSSPRSREIDYENPPSWEDQPPPSYKVRFMCSYGGKIHPRPHDNQLSYVGGETKILSVDRSIKFGPLLAKLMALCDSADAVSFKYQLPGEDLDALISVTNDDDLEHMMHEYDRLFRVSPKPARLRIFIFPSQISSSLDSSVRSFGSDEVKMEKDRFVQALNSAPSQQSAIPALAAAALPQSNVDFLFGLEKTNAMAAAAAPPVMGRVRELEDPVVPPGLDERLIGTDPIQKHILDLQRLRIEEQQGNYRRTSGDSISGGEYYKLPEKISHTPVAGGVPYWAESHVPGGVFPASTAVGNDQPVYIIPAPSNAYHAPPVMRPASAQPAPGYYAVPRMPSEVYRDQQMYSMVTQGVVPSPVSGPPTLPPQKVAGYSEGFGMVRPAPAGGGGVGMVTEAGYAQVAYDGGAGRQVVYTAPGGMSAPVSAQYQAIAAAMSGDMRSAGALNAEAGGKAVAAKATQASM